MPSSFDDDPIVVPRNPLNLGLFSLILGALALAAINILPGFLRDMPGGLGICVLIAILTSVLASVVGVVSIVRSRTDREKYGSPLMGILGICLSALWLVGALRAGIFSQIFNGKLF